MRDHRNEAPLLAGASHYAISATVTADPATRSAPWSATCCAPASAHGRRGARQHIPFPSTSRHGFGGMHHFDLLNHPDVWAAIAGSSPRGPSRHYACTSRDAAMLAR